MALNKAGLKTALQAAFVAQYEGTPTEAQLQSINDLATALSNAIDVYVKTGAISTTVSGTAGPYPVVGTGSGTIS